jgi:nucleotide-binding universal stress UspA family protein
MSTILIPTDFSPVAENATRYALELARQLQCNLIVYHSKEFGETDALAKLKRETDELKRLNPGISVNYNLDEKFFDAITLNEVDVSAGLIVLGTSGKHAAFQKKLFGTHAAEISENLKYPVLVIPDNVKYEPISKIAFACDFYALENEMPPVVDFARVFGARLMVFHVEPVFPDLGKTEKRNLEKEIEELKIKLV